MFVSYGRLVFSVVSSMRIHQVLPVSTIACSHKTCNADFMMQVFHNFLMAGMSSPWSRLCVIGWDGHAAFQRAENIALGIEAIPPACDEMPFWTECRSLPSPSPTWGFGALAARHQRDRKWYIVHSSTDVAHAMKAAVGQARSACRTIMLGDTCCDFSAFLEESMPLPALVGKDLQSDTEAATFLHFLRVSADTLIVDARKRGAMLFAILVSLLTCAWLCKCVSLPMRHLIAAATYYYLRMAKVYADRVAHARGYKADQRQRRFMSIRTWRTMHGKSLG